MRIYRKILKKEVGADKTKHKSLGQTRKIVEQQYQYILVDQIEEEHNNNFLALKIFS